MPRPTADPLVDVVLGGLAVREPTDGELVTAIVNPTHALYPAGEEERIWPWDAAKAGAGIVATSRCDFPNQVNRAITDEMAIAAGRELARCTEEGAADENSILPRMEEWEVIPGWRWPLP